MDSNATPENPADAQLNSSANNEEEEKVVLLFSTRMLNAIKKEDINNLLDQVHYSPSAASVNNILRFAEEAIFNRGNPDKS